ncbi:MAG: hypothetical protein FWF20_04155 [Betaproteobacteria bacterium]|nr:hypothetical protein [Betaproteobacteria bacterium]MCL2885971.1 hypothetical protein [Betaproteobacteria bacterium]
MPDSDPDLRKKREILFSRFPPGQVPEAADDLRRVEDLEIEAHHERRAIDVAYDLRQHSLRELEEHLVDKGYHLDNTLLSKLTRALIHYVEDTQLHNIDAPEKPIKRFPPEAYVQAWERHPHGDHDDTPPEWREYK